MQRFLSGFLRQPQQITTFALKGSFSEASGRLAVRGLINLCEEARFVPHFLQSLSLELLAGPAGLHVPSAFSIRSMFEASFFGPLARLEFSSEPGFIRPHSRHLKG